MLDAVFNFETFTTSKPVLLNICYKLQTFLLPLVFIIGDQPPLIFLTSPFAAIQ